MTDHDPTVTPAHLAATTTDRGFQWNCPVHGDQAHPDGKVPAPSQEYPHA